MVNMDETLKRFIIRKAIKLGCPRDGASIRYAKRLYYVHIINDEVIQQYEYK